MKKVKTTTEEFIESLTSQQRKQFEQEYRDFLVSEMVFAAMEQDNVSVEVLAKIAGVAPTIIQDACSGKDEDVSFESVVKILKALGYKLMVEREGASIPVKV